MLKWILSVTGCVVLATNGVEAATRFMPETHSSGFAQDVVLVSSKKLVDGQQAPSKSQTGNSLAPLTEAECTGLGGKNLDAFESQCSSGRICARADQDGVIHKVCITKSAQ